MASALQRSSAKINRRRGGNSEKSTENLLQDSHVGFSLGKALCLLFCFAVSLVCVLYFKTPTISRSAIYRHDAVFLISEGETYSSIGVLSRDNENTYNVNEYMYESINDSVNEFSKDHLFRGDLALIDFNQDSTSVEESSHALELPKIPSSREKSLQSRKLFRLTNPFRWLHQVMCHLGSRLRRFVGFVFHRSR